MPTREEAQAVVIECLRYTLGFEDEDISEDMRLAVDLGAESMDFVDIMGRVGRRLSVKMDMGRLDDALKKAMSAPEFEQGVLTEPGVAVLETFFPHAESGEIYEGMPLHEVPFLISVRTLIDFAVGADPAG